METVTFVGAWPLKIGLVVRGMAEPLGDPAFLEQHADCTMSDGSPIGFYGQGPPRSGGEPAATANKAGLNLQGAVYDFHRMFVHRRWYVDLAAAKAWNVRSTLLTVNVTESQARAFDSYWRSLLLRPGGFDLIGNNCSSHASEAFLRAGIVRRGIPGLDTPVHLYRQLRQVQGLHRTRSHSGHVGFVRRSGGHGYDVVID